MLASAQNLKNVAATVLRKAGSEEDEARIVADHLVRANLAGHDSHGIGMIPYYVRFFVQGLLQPNTPATIVKDDGAVLMFDGGRGYGQRVAAEAMNAAIERCRKTGVVVMTLRTSHHVGRVGTYGEQAIAAGFVSIHFVNVQDHPPLVAPYRGSDARFGTNPICVAVPGSQQTPPFLLDMATSLIALGKVRVAMNKGEKVPDGHLIDHTGQPTNDPNVMFTTSQRGALLPIGAHKGYGLAMACEILAGVLSGGGTIAPQHDRKGAIVNNMLSFVVDPERLVDRDWMMREIEAMVAYAKDSPPARKEEPVLVAGDPEREYGRQRESGGITVDETTWKEILDAGASLGLDRDVVGRIALGEPAP